MRKTKIDWLKFRTQSTFAEVFKAVKPAFCGGGELLELGPEIQGKDGWESRRQVMISDLHIASIDYGGDSQRGWTRFDMSGKGCEWVEDWNALEAVKSSLLNCELRRIDICLDTFDGSVTHEGVLAAHEQGEFKRAEGGRNPKLKKVESSCPTDGRTIYIGARSSYRFIRCYEKGWEQVAKMGIPDSFLKPGLMVAFEGEMVRPEDYYRVEVEFKATDDTVIPWPAVTDSDAYFAGAAPFCERLIGVAPRRAQAVPSELEPKAILASQMEHCRRAYGGLFRTILELYGNDPETKARFFDEFAADKPSDRLIREGVLTVRVDHDT